MQWLRHVRFSAAGFGLAALVGCAKPDKPAPETPPPAASVPTAPPVVTITAGDFSYQAPDTIPAGVVTLRLVNEGRELHHLMLMKGKASDLAHTKPDDPPPPGTVIVGGPNGAVPGMSTEATVEVEPGEYTMVCLIPSPDGKPHLIKGMSRPVVVHQSGNNAKMPTADITVTLTDYAFGFSQPLTVGRHVLRIENPATQPHEIVIVKLNPGKTAKDFAAWALKPDGPPPGMPIASSAPMSTGRTVTFPVEITPGDYGLLCFVPDAKDSKLHTAHGMLQDLKIS